MANDDDSSTVPPLARAELAVTNATLALGAADAASNRQTAPVILVVEDSQDNRDLYATFFHQKGYRVITANDGPEGLQKALETRPDVIVLDLGLPFIDGWDVARLLRADPITKHVPIIACSGFASPLDQQRAMDAGVDSFIVKPCEPGQLYEALLQHLSR